MVGEPGPQKPTQTFREQTQPNIERFFGAVTTIVQSTLAQQQRTHTLQLQIVITNDQCDFGVFYFRYKDAFEVKAPQTQFFVFVLYGDKLVWNKNHMKTRQVIRV